MPRDLIGQTTEQLIKQRDEYKKQGMRTDSLDAELKQRELEEDIHVTRSDRKSVV